ncbi:MFS transporter [Guptibacillus sedimenti]|uniref:MFS transporter n=1 Tax=Guptibacillus sedimenti TaxID=3025680 RepID=UPI00235FFFFE|nr:MFS transporter [Pseudalkalibacillus sedimenti]
MKNKNFVSFFGGSVFSALGDAIFMIAISWYIADVFNSGSLMGLVLLLMGVCRFIFGLVGGVIADAVGPKIIMVISDLLRGLIITFLCIALSTSYLPIWLLFIVAVLFGTVDAFYWPAAEALKPKLVKQAQFSQANSVYFTTVRMINIFGPVIGGVLIAANSYILAMIIVLFSFLFSAVLISLIKIKLVSDTKDEVPGSSGWKSFLADLHEGLLFVKNEKILLTLIVTMFFANIGANGIMAVLPFLVEEMNLSADALGGIQMAMAIGATLVGGILTFKAIKTPSMYYVTAGFLGQGIFFGLVYWLGSFLMVAGSLFMVGVFTALVGVFIPTIIQTIVPQNLMGRVGSVLMTVSMASTPLAHFTFGFLTDIYGPKSMFLIAGVTEVSAAVISLIYLKLSQIPFVIEREVSQ